MTSGVVTPGRSLATTRTRDAPQKAFARHNHRFPNVNHRANLQAEKTSFDHSDDLKPRVADLDRTANRHRIAREAPLPKSLTDESLAVPETAVCLIVSFTPSIRARVVSGGVSATSAASGAAASCMSENPQMKNDPGSHGPEILSRRAGRWGFRPQGPNQSLRLRHPSASVRMATAVKPEERRNVRTVKRKSCPASEYRRDRSPISFPYL
jgi:hypothetical protein